MPKWFIVVVVGVTVELEEEIKALQIRFPFPLYNKLSERAKKSRRSLNSEVIIILEEFFTKPTKAYLPLESENIKDMLEKINNIYEHIKKPFSFDSIGIDHEEFKALSPIEQKQTIDQLEMMTGTIKLVKGLNKSVENTKKVTATPPTEPAKPKSKNKKE